MISPARQAINDGIDPLKPKPPYRRKAARGITEQHSRHCPLSRRASRRCDCHPSYIARLKHDGRTHAATFTTLADAANWLETNRRQLKTGLPIHHSRLQPAPCVADVAVSFLARAQAGDALTRSRRRYSQRTIELYESILRLYVLPYTDPRTGLRLADLPCDQIYARTIQNLVDHLVTKHGICVARHAGVALAATLRHAYTRGHTDNLPPRVLLPPNPPPRDRALTTEEVDQLLTAAVTDDRAYERSFLHPLLHLLADTGCRISEAIGLDWGPQGLDMTAEPPVARISRDTTKTDAGERTVPLGATASAALRRHYLATGRPTDGTPVFRGQHGERVLRNGRTSEGIKRVANAAGLEGVTAHTLRHTHITWLVAAGVPNPIAAQRVGQTRLLTQTYAHPGQREDLAALAAIENYRSQA